MEKTRILMVCLGNICRSPLAEGIMRSKLFGRKKFEVDSAGTGGWHTGEAPDPRSIAIAKEHGLDISGQRGRQFGVNDFDRFDHIFVMDNSNYRDVIRLARNDQDKQKVSLILDAIFPGENVDVPDPYYGGTDGFANVYDMLDQACDIIKERI
ncbi:low molecular weight protein-tyrosine-phosphatase [Gilvibacter sediminis]|uniref:low molecular weight protein-tyrosine-phosphatase n=1 Tax=Gilvibacter sediminis TaxID=379071 RepID=UPI002350F647|nr:low molecular weight protein-tyrosine-phosphatase [Gilvibacter sediminis]MDC7997831.1 low molecular weight phosphotyrosine protein phosphatase [Gilvibacter sediminis]